MFCLPIILNCFQGTYVIILIRSNYFLLRWNSKYTHTGCWRGGSAVKNIFCSCRGLKFSSHTHVAAHNHLQLDSQMWWHHHLLVFENICMQHCTCVCMCVHTETLITHNRSINKSFCTHPHNISSSENWAFLTVTAELLVSTFCTCHLLFNSDNSVTWNTRCYAEEREFHRVMLTQEKTEILLGGVWQARQEATAFPVGMKQSVRPAFSSRLSLPKSATNYSHIGYILRISY